jgi:hypothetical protein
MATIQIPTPTAKKRVSTSYGDYNPRRMSKPWIARITAWPVGGNPVLEFGSYVGDANGGEVEIMAKIGDIIRDGQKDYRGHDSINDWSVVDVDYTLLRINQVDARHMYAAAQK